MLQNDCGNWVNKNFWYDCTNNEKDGCEKLQRLTGNSELSRDSRVGVKILSGFDCVVSSAGEQYQKLSLAAHFKRN